MGKRARDWHKRNSTVDERLAHGIELAEHATRAILIRNGIDPDSKDPEEIQRAFWVLRREP